METIKKKAKTVEKVQSWEKLLASESIYNDYEFPKVSIVIPTYDCAQSISTTIESVFQQDYPDFEVIIVDAGSNDRTIEVINSYRNDKIRIYSVSSNQRYEMLNKGITQSNGFYINFLFPGDFYIFPETLKVVMTSALNNNKPNLVYCGTLLRDGRTEVKIMFREFTLELLQKGQQPTSLQSCWWRADLFPQLGKFSTEYQLRGGYDLMCRFLQSHKYTHIGVNRVLTDYDLRLVTRSMIIRHFWETLITVNNGFGFWAMLKWLAHQKDFSRFLRLWWRSVKVAFVGR